MESILDKCDDLQFFKMTRLSRECFNYLLDQVQENIQNRLDESHRGGRKPISVKKIVLIGLWYLANDDVYRKIGKTWGVTESTAHGAVKLFIHEVNNLRSKYIFWPNEEEIALEEAVFLQRSAIPGTIGCIDGCHVKIRCPQKKYQKDYLNRNHQHSINMLAVCDSKMRFTFVSAGSPGSWHDQRALFKSELWDPIEDRNGNDIFPSAHYHIIGDSAFKLMPNLIVPYKDNGKLTVQQKKFNKELSRARHLIENSFALLKGRFRRLLSIDAELEKIPGIIMAAAVLHNISFKFPDYSNYFELVDPTVTLQRTRPSSAENPSREGTIKRDRLASRIM